MSQSSIEWTEMTWNPTTGCDKVSAGCKYCYAEVMTRRLQAMGIEKYKDGFDVRIHEDIPPAFIAKVFEVMNNTPQHTYQILTKRAGRLNKLHDQLHWSSNIWMGVSVENEKVKHRIEFLRETNAKVKFLSCEPLIG